MAYAYGTTLGSTIRMYVKYDVIDTDFTYKITIQEIGLYNYSDTYNFAGTNNGGNIPVSITAFGRTKSDSVWGATEYRSKTYGEAENFLPFSNTYTKTDTPQTVAINGSMKVPAWAREKGSSGWEMSAGTSTLSFNITVPSIAKPTIKFVGEDTGRDKRVPTTIGLTVSVSSFEGDEITSIYIRDENGNELAKKEEPFLIPSSGVQTQNFIVQGVTTGSITAYASCVGLGGSSAEEKVTIGRAFMTMDVQSGGKEIAFGGSAISETADDSENGEFNCFMDANFHREVFLMGDPVKDHPVEQGKSNNWFYQKFASGEMVAYRRFYWSSITFTSATGGGYTQKTDLAMPDGFVDIPSVVMTPQSGNYVSVNVANVSKTSCDVNIARHFGSGALSNYYFGAIAFGQWK